MTIFQKMLLTPLLSLTLYTGFLLYGLAEYNQRNNKVGEISENYLKILEITAENSRLFKEMEVQFKDAVLTGERDWALETRVAKTQINNNFRLLAQFSGNLDPDFLNQLKENFNLYHKNALTLSLALLKDGDVFSENNKLIKSVEFYNKKTTLQLDELKQDLKRNFSQAIEQSNATLNHILFFGGSIGALILILMVGVISIVSISTRNSFQEVIDRMKALAEGRPDFSQRLKRNNRDELGYLVYWFNKLSDALEHDYSKIEQLSITDKLTQLHNRAHTDDVLKQQLEHAQVSGETLVSIIADIDHFKAINDTYGHQVGDNVLQEFAVLVMENTRPQDFVGRWGGEEFVIVMPDINRQQAKTNAERLRHAIEQHDFTDAGQITASFGVTLSVAGDTPESMIKRSDENLYIAKNQGRNQVVFDNV